MLMMMIIIIIIIIIMSQAYCDVTQCSWFIFTGTSKAVGFF